MHYTDRHVCVLNGLKTRNNTNKFTRAISEYEDR